MTQVLVLWTTQTEIIHYQRSAPDLNHWMNSEVSFICSRDQLNGIIQNTQPNKGRLKNDQVNHQTSTQLNKLYICSLTERTTTKSEEEPYNLLMTHIFSLTFYLTVSKTWAVFYKLCKM